MKYELFLLLSFFLFVFILLIPFSFNFVHASIFDPTYVFSISNNIDYDYGEFKLGGAFGIATVQIGRYFYALVASSVDDGVQIIDITNPHIPIPMPFIDDDKSGFDELNNPKGITTIEINNSFYALVASSVDDGVQIIDITNPYNPSPVVFVSEGVKFDELDGPVGITTVQIGNFIYALVASSVDDGVQIMNISAMNTNDNLSLSDSVTVSQTIVRSESFGSSVGIVTV